MREVKYLSHYGTKGMSWYHRYHQSYGTVPTRSGKVGTEHFSENEKDKIKIKKTDEKYLKVETSSEAHVSDEDEKREKRLKRFSQYKALFNVAMAALTLNPIRVGYAIADLKHLSDAKIADIKTKKLQSTSTTVDNETGLKLKEREYTEKEDVERVNPGFKNFSDTTKNNCMLCTTTLELRKRGYDVTANKASTGYNTGDVKRWFKDPKPMTISVNDKDYIPNNALTVTNLNSKFEKIVINALKDQGDSRGNLMVTWNYGGGHSVFYEVKNNEVKIIDAQCNKIYKANSYPPLKGCIGAEFIRMDNLELNKKGIKEVCH